MDVLAAYQAVIQTWLKAVEHLPVQPLLVNRLPIRAIEAPAFFVIEDGRRVAQISLIQRPAAAHVRHYPSTISPFRGPSRRAERRETAGRRRSGFECGEPAPRTR